MKLAADAVQAAIYALLTGDTGAGGLFAPGAELVTGVFETADVPETEGYPFISIGDYSSDGSMSTLGREGELALVEIDVWDQSHEYKRINTIATRLNELLGDASLTVTGYALARSVFSAYRTVNDHRDRVQRGMLEYQVWLQESP